MDSFTCYDFFKMSNFLPTNEERLKRFLSKFVPLSGLSLPAAVHRGIERISGQDGSVLAIGPKHVVDYIPRRFFRDGSTIESLGKIPLWNVPSLLNRYQPTVDFTAIVMDHWSAKRVLERNRYLICPTWVASWMPLTPEFNVRNLSNLNHSMSRDMAYVRNGRFAHEISLDHRELDHFYDRFYIPYVIGRHGGLANMISRRKIRSIMRRGNLVWLERKGKRVAGLLSSTRRGNLEIAVIGLADGNIELLRGGTMSSLYFHAIQYGIDLGATSVFFGGSRPSLHDGVFRFKRKWGAIICEHPGLNYDMFLNWNRFQGRVANFFSHTSIIHRENKGSSALWVYPESLLPVPERIAVEINHIKTPGLQKMRVIMQGSVPERIDLPEGVELLKMNSNILESPFEFGA